VSVLRPVPMCSRRSSRSVHIDSSKKRKAATRGLSATWPPEYSACLCTSWLRHGPASRRCADADAQITVLLSAFICITPFPQKEHNHQCTNRLLRRALLVKQPIVLQPASSTSSFCRSSGVPADGLLRGIGGLAPAFCAGLDLPNLGALIFGVVDLLCSGAGPGRVL